MHNVSVFLNCICHSTNMFTCSTDYWKLDFSSHHIIVLHSDKFLLYNESVGILEKQSDANKYFIYESKFHDEFCHSFMSCQRLTGVTSSITMVWAKCNFLIVKSHQT